MIVDISTSEVLKLTHILWQAYLNEDKKYYAINEEPLYSYSEEKRNAKKKERQQCIVNEGMYLDHYHYWDCLIGHIHHPQIPYIDDIGTVDVDFDEVQQILTLLNRMIFESNDPGDIVDFSDAYQYWTHVLERTSNEN